MCGVVSRGFAFCFWHVPGLGKKIQVQLAHTRLVCVYKLAYLGSRNLLWEFEETYTSPRKPLTRLVFRRLVIQACFWETFIIHTKVQAKLDFSTIIYNIARIIYILKKYSMHMYIDWKLSYVWLTVRKKAICRNQSALEHDLFRDFLERIGVKFYCLKVLKHSKQINSLEHTFQNYGHVYRIMST